MTTLTPLGLYTLLAVGLALTVLVGGSITTVVVLGTRIDTANAHRAEQATRRISRVKAPRKQRDNDTTTTSGPMVKRLRAPLALTETALVILALIVDIPTPLEPLYVAVIITLALAVAICCAVSWPQHHHPRRR